MRAFIEQVKKKKKKKKKKLSRHFLPFILSSFSQLFDSISFFFSSCRYTFLSFLHSSSSSSSSSFLAPVSPLLKTVGFTPTSIYPSSLPHFT